jgi:hypothetical protein
MRVEDTQVSPRPFSSFTYDKYQGSRLNAGSGILEFDMLIHFGLKFKDLRFDFAQRPVAERSRSTVAERSRSITLND